MAKTTCDAQTTKCAKCKQHRREHKPGGRAEACTFRGILCARPPLAGRVRCRLHGGASLSGEAHPNFTTGRYSKTLPKRLLDSYRAALDDPDLTDGRAEIALLEARTNELLEQVGATGNTKLWKEAVDNLQAFRRAASAGGDSAVGAARIALEQLDQVLTRGLSASATWDELRETLDLRRRMADSQTKRLKDQNLMVTTTAALAILVQFYKVVSLHVTDSDARAAIAAEFRRLSA